MPKSFKFPILNFSKFEKCAFFFDSNNDFRDNE